MMLRQESNFCSCIKSLQLAFVYKNFNTENFSQYLINGLPHPSKQPNKTFDREAKLFN